MKKPKQVLYANATNPVGKVRVYKCPLCDDGEKLKKYEDNLAIAVDALITLDMYGAQIARAALAKIKEPSP